MAAHDCSNPGEGLWPPTLPATLWAPETPLVAGCFGSPDAGATHRRERDQSSKNVRSLSRKLAAYLVCCVSARPPCFLGREHAFGLHLPAGQQFAQLCQQLRVLFQARARTSLPISTTSQSVCAITVALRRSPVRSDISPKQSPVAQKRDRCWPAVAARRPRMPRHPPG